MDEGNGQVVGTSSIVADLVDRLTARVQAGEAVDWEEVARQYPEHAQELRRLWPAVGALDELSRSGDAELSGIASLAAGKANVMAGLLGDFRIVREVGKGGMGIVYEAEQVSLRRRVALKVLPFAATMDSRHLQRFHNEAQAAACLHHTNIVPVFSVGCERGVHFYAMQFIDGQPLSELIHQMRQREKKAPTVARGEATVVYPTPADAAASTPLPAAEMTPLSGEGRRGRDYFRKVAELGVQAAVALDHAHQLGIVHRDIKPANLLLDGTGRVWITDFGLAHVQHSEASLTLTGQTVGTPRYMSPEQALAKRVPIDHRTDVYSLGVTLYELLTLRPAFASEDRHELLRQIAFDDPARPRRFERAIPAELEIIVLKAMEKRPQDRYTTAQELADDLRRYLNHEPIRARRPSLTQGAIKWCKRHQTAVVTAAVVSFVAAIGLSVAVALIWQANSQKAALLIAKDEALIEKAQALKRAKSYFQDALKIIEAETRSNNIDETNRKGLVGMEKVLQSTVALAEKCAADYPDEAEVCRILTMTNTQLSSYQQALGRFVRAVESQRRAVAVCRHWASAFPENRVASQAGPAVLASQLRSLGRLLQQTSHFREAEQTYEEVQALWDQIEKVAITDEDNLLRRRIEYANDLGNVRLEAGRLPEARQAFGQAITLIQRKLSDDAPLTDVNGEQEDCLYLRSSSRNGLANVFLEEGHPEEAARTFRQTRQDFERLPKGFPDHLLGVRELDRAWFLVTCPVKEVRDPARAVALASEVIENSSRDNPNHRQLAQAWKVRALAHYRTGDWEAAKQALDRSEAHRSLDGTAQFVRSMVTWQQGKKEIARKTYDSGVRWMEKFQPSNLELLRFRSEAAGLLGIQTPRKVKPMPTGAKAK
jgi:serine/threonine protein kinase